MTLPTPLVPRRPVPALDVPLVGGGRFVLGEAPGAAFDLLVFYRGLHCPVCAKYLLELERLEPEYAARGVHVVALSSDGEERAARMAEKVRAQRVRFGYGLTLAEARTWGLYLSRGKGVSSIGIEEPERFSEPGVFLVRPDGTLYHGSVQTMPFARPHFDELLTSVDFALKQDYPARGEDVEPA